MMLPDGNRTRVDRAKIADYLLSLSHPDGRSKAEFFMRFGFKVEDWEALANALREVGISNPVTSLVESAHGDALHCGWAVAGARRTGSDGAHRVDRRFRQPATTYYGASAVEE